jgi:broad specificity phosphatase PhoE
MTGSRATRYLYLVRHGEASADGTGLTETGRRQATLLGRRLRDIPFAAVHCGPLPRAERTARLVHAHLTGDVPLRVRDLAGDYVPYFPARDELPSGSADFFLRFLAGATEEERTRGPELARRARDLLTGPADGEEDRHELGNASLTVIRYSPDRPATPLFTNDMRHLPAELRWTGFAPGSDM